MLIAVPPRESGLKTGTGDMEKITMDFRNEHPAEDVIEQYLFGSLTESQTEALEEHLLVCHGCVDAAEKLLIFVESMRTTLERTGLKVRAAGKHSPSED